jgi:signal transduction histidine kinase
VQRVAFKIWLGCLLIVGVGAIAMIVSYRGMVRVQRELHHLADVHEPLKAAATEMEINVKGIAIGTLAYLSAPNPAFRELVSDAEEDFIRFHEQYDRLALSQEQKDLGARLTRLFEEFKGQNRELKARRDGQAVAFAEVLAKLEELDRLFDQQLPSTLDPQRRSYTVKLESISAVDEGIDGIRMRLATYRWSRQADNRTHIDRNIADCRAAFQQLRQFQWTREGYGEAVRTAEKLFDEAVGKVEQVLDDEDEIHGGVARFIALREEIDSLLDDEVQPLAAELLRRPRERTEALTGSVVFQMAWLISLFIISAILVSLALARVVVKPLQSLARGTELVSRGDLAHRVPLIGGGEFAILALAFNRMVSRLQETLVSKETLEKSEQELQRTVRALEQEFLVRTQAEAERMRLQASLRRAETLSAIGTLVAGVAHQVRNPLFSISSVLDAMEARLGQREEYRRYLEVLRGEVTRMVKLMQELMEYGRSESSERSAATVAEVVREAVLACRTLAETAQVTIEERMEVQSGMAVDRQQLARALENLVENAIQHSPAGGIVTITATPSEEDGGKWVEIRVEDEGPGFREKDMPRLFEPFFTRREGGTGLGMALVERIIRSHGGQVLAGNRPGGGAVLTVRLPVDHAEVPDLAESRPGDGRKE